MKYSTKRLILNTCHVVFALLIMLVSFIGLVFFGLNLCYRSTYVYGRSMYPTLNEHVISNSEQGDFVLVNRYKTEKVGDIVIATPSWSNKTVIKRLVGTPGDTIEIKKTDKYELYCNGNLIYTKAITDNSTRYYEKYCSTLSSFGIDKIELKDNEYFIMGDNWGDTSDSITNNFQTIKKSQLYGRIDLIVDKNESSFWGVLSFGLKALFSI